MYKLKMTFHCPFLLIIFSEVTVLVLLIVPAIEIEENRLALLVNCSVIIHCLEVICKEDRIKST